MLGSGNGMSRRALMLTCGLVALAAATPAFADRIAHPTAVFAGLDKITGRIISFEAAIDEWLVLTDHSPQLRVANGLTVERLTSQIGIVEAIDRSLGGAFRLLKGIEVDILDDGGLDQTDAMLARLDLVTASVHSKLRMNGGPMTTRMVKAVSNPRVNVLGHCTGRLVTGSRGTRPPSDFDARAVFEACAEHGTAVEINSRPERRDPPDELVLLALDIGCVFSIDSDAHAPGQLDMKAYGCERAERLGVPADRIVTTWDASRLLEWAGSGS